MTNPRRTRRLPVVAALSLFLLVMSCSDNLKKTTLAVAATSTAVNAEFTTVRQAEETLVRDITGLYENLDKVDLTTKGMDTSEGGIYATFPGFKYYYKSVPQASALYVSPGRPVTDDIRRQVKFLEAVDPFLQKAGKATDVQVTAFYGIPKPTTIALLNPWFDVVSRLPPGLDLNVFEWYTRGLKSPGPPIWSAQPFTDLSTGWVMDVSVPIRVSGEDKGVAVISVDLAKLSAKHLNGQEVPLVLLGSGSIVAGMNQAAEALLKISALQSIDFVKQMRENSFAPGKYKLTDSSQNADIQALGTDLQSGKTDFPVTLYGKAYVAVQKPIPENGMTVVGFSAP